ADHAVLVVAVAHHAHGRPAVDQHAPGLARGHDQGGVTAFFVGQPGRGARRATHLGAAAGVQLDRVHVHARRDVAEGHAVAHRRLDGRVGGAEDLVAVLEALGGEDVALDAVGVLDQGDVAGAVGVVLDPDHGALDAVTVAPL